jgi:hypothetical protein
MAVASVKDAKMKSTRRFCVKIRQIKVVLRTHLFGCEYRNLGYIPQPSFICEALFELKFPNFAYERNQ